MNVCTLLLIASYVSATVTYVSLSSGDPYFISPTTQLQWFPKGVAYQTWDKDIGQWQTNAQIDYDLRQMKLYGVNSLYVTWNNRAIQDLAESRYDFNKTDYLVSKATSYGIKLFVQLGSNLGSSWWPGMSNRGKVDVDPGYLTMHPPINRTSTPSSPGRTVADQISYENASTKSKYQDFLKTVVTRYKTNTNIAGWIVGNNYAYMGVWNGIQTGYDNSSITAFQTYLNSTYSGKITNLNANWNTSYTKFTDISSPDRYNRDSPAWYDFTMWRQTSIATFVCQGISAVNTADPNHLISYAVDGMIPGFVDWMFDGSDIIKIASTCKAMSAGLDFISLNNYIQPGSVKQGMGYGINYAKRTGLPIMITEVGVSTTQSDYNITEHQQGAYLISNIYEAAVVHFALGVHVFHWHDRIWGSSSDYGYGISTNDRYPKLAWYDVREVFNFLVSLKFHSINVY
jgi:hypothetical protein